ncbi:4-amino-4-deoxychorismate lyase [Solibacillus sp. R5-41]|uniref:aminodeoxychorismate lyase n=1 Tax=Solibacillus sp. R5-41 TaxID=2048654 RepID=UPI000C12908D|nr:aminodeoxychorismate lyase [Solibacillus sp. R5-41]ATP38636.1 4-amino-4-deoxychorismate lyase [Solibacillus sp. R5-41]
MLCWMNGHYIEEQEMRISPFDHGFLYGLGFFETFRTYEGQAVLLQEHLNRLLEALKEYRIAFPYTLTELEEIIRQLNAQDGQDGYFRLNVSAGPHSIGLAPTEYVAPTVIVFRKPLQVAKRGTEKQAVWLKTPRNSPEQEIRYKSHHYGNNVRARLELPSLAEFEGFFTTNQGIVAEGITSNVFWVKGGILFTPSIETGILPGITRKVVLELAQQMKIPVREGSFIKQELEQADECFITTAVQELVPISNIDQICFAGNEGRIYGKLHNVYLQNIVDRLGRK